MNFNLYLSPDISEAEVSVQIDIYTMKQILQWVEKIDQRHGPDRDIGPVTFYMLEKPMRITIETQKQGTYELTEGEYGELKVTEGPLLT